jgi:A/G-specific adenine glycosylase
MRAPAVHRQRRPGLRRRCAVPPAETASFRLVDTDALLAWYDRVRRPLPWRSTRDPYALLVSEVMLQQTQALRVVPYYERWLARFPDAPSLAQAPARDVLEEWSGLGYNRRALALQAAARVVATSGWPEDLTELPGVGPYTAAAVASFAWDRQEAAIDTNVRRVLERREGRFTRERVAQLLPPGRAAAFNQAMMELGATVCRPRAPRCDACPIARGCAGGPVTPRRRGAERFEESDRYARGRVVAALVRGERPPPVAERILAGLERDGLLVRAADGPRLPRA